MAGQASELEAELRRLGLLPPLRVRAVAPTHPSLSACPNLSPPWLRCSPLQGPRVLTALEMEAAVAEAFIFTEGLQEFAKLERSREEGKVYVHRSETAAITLGEQRCRTAAAGEAGAPIAACQGAGAAARASWA